MSQSRSDRVQPPAEARRTAEISLKRRCGLWLTAWAAAFVIAMPNPVGVIYIWMFPLGLLYVVGWKYDKYDVHYVVGWLPYAVLTIAAMLVRRRRTFFVIYGVLCAFLVLNVGGCRSMQRGMRDLH